MSEDRRELILARMKTIAEKIPGVTAFRNTLNIPDEELPAISILDGDETSDDSAYGRGRPSTTSVIMAMRPQVYVFVQDRNAGTELNGLRTQFIYQMLVADTTLQNLTHNGDIRYLGFATGFASGRSLSGEAGFEFELRYVLRPTQL